MKHFSRDDKLVAMGMEEKGLAPFDLILVDKAEWSEGDRVFLVEMPCSACGELYGEPFPADIIALRGLDLLRCVECGPDAGWSSDVVSFSLNDGTVE